jgi:RNase P subunit RPR2
MDEKIFYGAIQIEDIANALLAEFNQAPWQAQRYGTDKHQTVIQIASRPNIQRGGATALTVHLRQLSNGVAVQMGQQAWLNLAASVGTTILAALRNPWYLLSRLDDLAQDIESIQLSERVWQVIESVAQVTKASHQIDATLQQQICEYCLTPNAPQEAHCVACGAPLPLKQVTTCPQCGFPLPKGETICPNCHQPVHL